jgi:hypothetical protein
MGPREGARGSDAHARGRHGRHAAVHLARAGARPAVGRHPQRPLLARATLFHMATGVPPFSAQTTGADDHAAAARARAFGLRAQPGVSDGPEPRDPQAAREGPALRYQTPGRAACRPRPRAAAGAPAIDVRSLDRAEPGRGRKVARSRRSASLVLAGVRRLRGLSVRASDPEAARPIPSPRSRASSTRSCGRGEDARRGAARCSSRPRARRARSLRARCGTARALRAGLAGRDRPDRAGADGEGRCVARRARALARRAWRSSPRSSSRVCETASGRAGGAPARALPSSTRPASRSSASSLDRIAHDRDAAYLRCSSRTSRTRSARLRFERFSSGRGPARLPRAEAGLLEALRGLARPGRPAGAAPARPDGPPANSETGSSRTAARRPAPDRRDEDRAAGDLKRGDRRDRSTGSRSASSRTTEGEPEVYEQFKKELPQHHPPASSFRQPADPWPTWARRQQRVRDTRSRTRSGSLSCAPVRGSARRRVCARCSATGEAEKETPMLVAPRAPGRGAGRPAHCCTCACWPSGGAAGAPARAAARAEGERHAAVAEVRGLPAARAPGGSHRRQPRRDREARARGAAHPDARAAVVRTGLRRPRSCSSSEPDARAEGRARARASPSGSSSRPEPGAAVRRSEDERALLLERPARGRRFGAELPRPWRPLGREPGARRLRALYQEKAPDRVRAALATLGEACTARARSRPTSCADLRDSAVGCKRERVAAGAAGRSQEGAARRQRGRAVPDGAFRVVIAAEALASTSGAEEFTLASGELLARVQSAEPALRLRVLSISGDVPSGCEPNRITLSLRLARGRPRAPRRDDLVGRGRGRARAAACSRARGGTRCPRPPREARRDPPGACRSRSPRPSRAPEGPAVVPGAWHDVVLELGKTRRGTSVARACSRRTPLRQRDSSAQPLERGQLRARAECRVPVRVEGRWTSCRCGGSRTGTGGGEGARAREGIVAERVRTRWDRDSESLRCLVGR